MAYDVGFGAADIGDDGLWFEVRRDGGKDERNLRDRCSDDDYVGIGERGRDIVRGFIDYAKLQRRLQIVAGTTDADHMLYGMGALERERERSADQANAEDEQFIQWIKRKREQKPDCSMWHQPYRRAFKRENARGESKSGASVQGSICTETPFARRWPLL